MARRSESGCAVPFVLLLLFIGLIVILFSPAGAGVEPIPTSLVHPPAAAQGAISPGTAIVPCQPQIAVGKPAQVIYPSVHMRRSPGYVDKNDAQDAIHYLEMNDRINVKGGPEIRDGLCWWRVEHQGYEGWTADHSRDGRQLLTAGQ